MSPKRMSPKQAATQAELVVALTELIEAYDKALAVAKRGRWDRLAWVMSLDTRRAMGEWLRVTAEAQPRD